MKTLLSILSAELIALPCAAVTTYNTHTVTGGTSTVPGLSLSVDGQILRLGGVPTSSDSSSTSGSAAVSGSALQSGSLTGAGNIVTHDFSEVANALQGSKADSALQPTGDGSQLTGVRQMATALPYLTKKLFTSGVQQYRIGIAGDSFMNNAYGSFLYRLNQRLGVAGYHMDNATLSGSATENSDNFNYWITGKNWTISGTTGIAAFTNSSGTPFPMNVIHYYLVTTPTSGTVKLQCSLSGTGVWTDITAATSAVSSGTAGMVLSGSLPSRASYQTRIVSVGGTTTLIGALGYDSTVTGSIMLNFSRGGIIQHQFGYELNTAVWNPILADLAPDVVCWKTAVVPDLLATYMPGFFALFGNAYANTDWVIISPHPEADPTLNAQFIQNTATLRSYATENHNYFFDCFNLFGDVSNVTARFGAYSGVHLPVDADRYWVDVLFATGIFSNGDFVMASSVTGTLATANIPSTLDVSTYPNQTIELSSIGGTGPTLLLTASPIRDGVIAFKSSDGSGRHSIVSYGSENTNYPNALEVRSLTSPYGVTMWMRDGKVWFSAAGTRPSSSVTDAFHVNDGAAYFGGATTLAGGLVFTGTSAAPSNTTTPVAWRDVVISGTTYKLPLYQ